MKIKRFEEILAWQEARNLNKQLFTIIKNNERFNKYFYLKDQIGRAALSITSNIAEGLERGSNKEFIRFLLIAKSSTAEVQSQLYCALDLELITLSEFNDLFNQSETVAKLLSKFIYYLKSTLPPKHHLTPTRSETSKLPTL